MLKIVLLALFFSSTCYALEVHQHGHVSLEMAVDNMQVGAEIRGPAESFIGFEHKAKTKAEKNLISDAERTLVKNAVSIVGLSSDLNCELVENSISWDHDKKQEFEHDHDHDHGKEEKHDDDHDKHRGEHAELKASFTFKCKKSVKKTKLLVSLKKFFPKIQEIELAVLPSTGNAFAKDIKQEQESVDLP